MTALNFKRATFTTLHESGCWLIGNPWDVGSARLLQHLGLPAVATTSSGFAASLGREDGGVTLDELAKHVEALKEALDIPVHVDAERCFGDDPEGVAEAVSILADAGASGISIEDYDPRSGGFDPVDQAVERVAAAAEAAHRHGVLLTARADQGIHRPIDDPLVDEVVERLTAYREAGADCLYGPGFTDPAHIARIVAIGAPVNVLIRPGGPAVPELEALGVRRVSTGGMLAWSAYGALVAAVRELESAGTTGFADALLSEDDVNAFR